MIKKIIRLSTFDNLNFENYMERREQLKKYKKETEKELIWIDIIRDWDDFLENKSKKFKEKLFFGIPDSQRPVIYEKLAGSSYHGSKERETLDAILKNYTENEFTGIIASESKTTSTHCCKNFESNVLELMEKVLRAYSIVDEELGYSAGMNFVANILASIMDGNECFWTFYGVMNGPRTRLREFYLNDSTRLRKCIVVLKFLLRKNECKLMNRLDACKIDFYSFAPQWFKTAFLCYYWSDELSYRIMDLFLYYGDHFLVTFAYVVFKIHRREIMNLPAGVTVSLLSHLDQSKSMTDVDKIFKYVKKNFISSKEFQKISNECEYYCT